MSSRQSAAQASPWPPRRRAHHDASRSTVSSDRHANSAGSITLRWTAPNGTSPATTSIAARPPAARARTPLNGGTPVTTTTYSDTTASGGTTYYYTVKAVNARAAASASSEANALTYPAAPTGLGATAGLDHADQPELDRPQRHGHRLQRLSRHDARRRELRHAAQRRHAGHGDRPTTTPRPAPARRTTTPSRR